MKKSVTILGIESSCDETSAAVLVDGRVLSNEIASQAVHSDYGGVVPELASRAHQANIIPVVDAALNKAGVNKKDISAIAYTRGPGLLGSLLVGSSFAKAFALALDIPLIDVHHMQAHVHALFIKNAPSFPFLCLTVSGGHTQILLVSDYFKIQILGETRDDAAGEAFDKIGKLFGLTYPAGPMMDQLAQSGNPFKFHFPIPSLPGYDFSFSGLKTSVLYFLKDQLKVNPAFIEENKNDLCASVQHTIVKILLDTLQRAALANRIKSIALAGGVAANSGLRRGLKNMFEEKDTSVFIPDLEYCTDNAAMIAMSGYLRFLQNKVGNQNQTSNARMEMDF